MKRASGALKSRLSKWKLKEEPGLKEPQGSRKQKLNQDLLVCGGLELFCKDFCQSLEHLLQLFAKFWELMQVLDAEWFEEGGGVLQAHVWALKMGLSTISPAVFRQLQRHLKAIKDIAEKLRDHGEVLQARDKAWVEKEHYQRKINELRSELSRRSQSGQAISAEQMERLQRNEAKNTHAQDVYDAMHTQALAYTSAKEELKSRLFDVVRTVTCGWFISVGAGVCRAVSEAESAQRGAGGERTPRSPAAGSGLMALPGWPLQDEPTEVRFEEVEELEPFDPANPFKGSWRCEGVVVEEEEPSDEGEASGPPMQGRPPAGSGSTEWAGEESEDETEPIEGLSEQELRQRLAERGLGVPPWCADRPALVELVRTLDGHSPCSTVGARTPVRKSTGSNSAAGAGFSPGLDEASPYRPGSTPGTAYSPGPTSPTWGAEVVAPLGPRFVAAAGVATAGGGGATMVVGGSSSMEVLQGLSDADLHEMLAASGTPAPLGLPRVELEERLLRSQGFC